MMVLAFAGDPRAMSPGQVKRRSRTRRTSYASGCPSKPQLPLTWGVSGQAHSFGPAAGVSPAKRGEAPWSRERSDLDAPAAGYTVRRARPCALLAASVASAARIHFGIASPLHFGIASPLPLDPKREPVFRMQPRRPHHLTSGRACRARTIIPHARGRRARVGGTILLGGVFQPGGAPVTARPDPAKPSRSASLEGGQVARPSLECWSVGVTEPSVRPP